MNTSLPARPRGLGLAGCLIGLLALIAVAIPQWVLPAVLPAGTAHHATDGAAHGIKERIMAKLKRAAPNAAPKKEEARSGLGEWGRLSLIATVSLGLLAVGLAVLSLIRREVKLYAGIAAALGIGAIALQAAILFAGAAIAILVLFLVLNQSDGGLQAAAIGIGAIFVFAVIALLGLGLASPLLTAVFIGAVIAILVVQWLLAGC